MHQRKEIERLDIDLIYPSYAPNIAGTETENYADCW